MVGLWTHGVGLELHNERGQRWDAVPHNSTVLDAVGVAYSLDGEPVLDPKPRRAGTRFIRCAPMASRSSS